LIWWSGVFKRVFGYFFLDKKVTKKSSLSNAAPLKANAPLAGQASQHAQADNLSLK
jgi:hypothetical protein